MLGAVAAGGFVPVFILRHLLVDRLVTSHPLEERPRRQFLFEAAGFFAAGVLAAFSAYGFYGFPVVSGVRLLSGYLVAGFFLSLDTALFRERQSIRKALKEGIALPPPKRLYSITRRFSLFSVAATLLVTMVVGMVIAGDVGWLSQIRELHVSPAEASRSVLTELLFVMGVLLAFGINLIVSYARNLRYLFDAETEVLKRVSGGDLSRKVPTATRDEFGVIAGYTNLMIEGLRHRTALLASLKVAEDVQKNLLPGAPPETDRLDIAGTSVYCDETGGDYYDYLRLPGGRLGVAVADASDHGIGSALFMASVRGFIRNAAGAYESPASLAEAANRFLAVDSGETGRFMTLFFLEIDETPSTVYLRWIRAGQDPALMYDPGADDFRTLSGEGPALGVDEGVAYKNVKTALLPEGGVIVIATDGVFETEKSNGEMFGRKRLMQVVRSHRTESAERIMQHILSALDVHRQAGPRTDDVTLVVIRQKIEVETETPT
jgi:sigma-B regulation protein RsbU (phosphoserine phosphatase)